MYVLQLMDWYSASFSVLFIAVVECIVINHVYSKYDLITNLKRTCSLSNCVLLC